MKRISTLSLLLTLMLAMAWQLNAQTPRMAFYEEATQASCPPCAGLNPPFQAFLNNNAETTIMMAYQVSWPGFDPMNLDNAVEVQDRVSYYGVSSAPTVIMQGTPTGQTYNQGQISNVIAETSEFALELNAEFVDDVIRVYGNVTAEMAASGDFRLRIALAEELITIGDAPGGTNGETEYHHVFKRFFGGSEGVDLQNTWTAGDTYEIDVTMLENITNIYNHNQLQVIAWIQNDDTRYVHQAAKVDHITPNFSFDNNAAIVDASVSLPAVCIGMNATTPTFTMENQGNETLTSAEIAYNINGGGEQTFSWTGNLMPFEEEIIVLDEVDFDHNDDTSILNVSVTNVNGVTDENEADNITVTINTATNVAGEVRLLMRTDNAGNETYWQMTNSQGEIVASGGNASVGLTNYGVGAGFPPSDPGSYGNNQFVIEDIELPANDCYSFTITDYYGDGFGLGSGFYRLISDGEVFTETTTFGAKEDRLFNSDLSVNTQEIAFTNTFMVSPNPVTDIAKVTFTIETAAITSITVINSLGQVVSEQNSGKLAVGTHQLDVDMNDLAAGIYLINIKSGEVSGTQTVVVR